jgi:hypothetical protein
VGSRHGRVMMGPCCAKSLMEGAAEAARIEFSILERADDWRGSGECRLFV